MRRGIINRAAAAGLALTIAAFASAATAQQQAGTPTGFGGFGAADRGPIQIEAEELEVRDKEGVAIFTGRVTVRQGETVLETPRLVVHYAAESASGANTAAGAGAAGGSQDIERLDADGRVIVTSGDQSATGDKASYDAKASQLELVGNVVLTQGQNVVRGDKLTVDLASGIAKVASSGRRVQMLLNPNAPAAGN